MPPVDLPAEHHVAAIWTLFGLLAFMVGPLIYGISFAIYFDFGRRQAFIITAVGSAWSILLLIVTWTTGYIQALVDWMNYGR